MIHPFIVVIFASYIHHFPSYVDDFMYFVLKYESLNSSFDLQRLNSIMIYIPGSSFDVYKATWF